VEGKGHYKNKGEICTGKGRKENFVGAQPAKQIDAPRNRLLHGVDEENARNQLATKGIS
jgi:hypothetical protein